MRDTGMISRTKALKLELAHHNTAAPMYAKRRESDFIWEIPEQLFLLKRVYFLPGMTVTDMGCGPAISVSRILGSRVIKNIRYIGVDISGKMLMYARRVIPSGTFMRADVETVHLAPNSSDIIISLGTLHHALNKKRTLAHWLSILRPGGHLFFREPTHEALPRGTGESPMEEGINVYEIVRFLESAHCRILEKRYFSSYAFHAFNRLLIKLRLGSWQRVKVLWYPVVLIDVLLANTIGLYVRFFRGLAVTLIVKKPDTVKRSHLPLR